MLLARLYPKAYVSSLKDISPDYFLDKGIKGIILDLDNTIIPWKAGTITPEMVDLITRYRESGLGLCVVSNALNKRVMNLLGPLGIPAVAGAKKPFRKPFLKAVDILGTTTRETAMVGDQLFTDILGGNRLGFYTILVRPISKKEFIGTRFVRLIEKLLLNRLIKKGIIDSPQ